MLHNYHSSVQTMAHAFNYYPWDNREAYAQFLAQTYYYVCHSTRLLAAAAGRFSQEDQAFHKRFLKHTDEENSHELLALRDLANLGFNIKDFRELPQTRTMYEIQYYKIEHRDPAALMGYILALETMAGQVLGPVKERLTTIYGKECARFIQVHADEDPDHIEKALKVMETLREGRHEAIDHNLEQTAICYSDMLAAAKAHALILNTKKVA
jgi:thiaminase